MADKHAVVAACASILIRLIVKIGKEDAETAPFGFESGSRNRELHGAYNSLMEKLRLAGLGGYSNFVRMDPESFDHLFNLVEPFYYTYRYSFSTCKHDT